MIMQIDNDNSLEPSQGNNSEIHAIYQTTKGKMYQGDCEEILKSEPMTKNKGRVQLLLTSPPFPLNRKKRYGNFTGEEYLRWLMKLAPLFREYLTQNGSIVLELGNAWEAGKPVMSTLPIRALLAFQDAAGLNLCQEFICYNPARLPTPAQWVTIERTRVKDAFTRVWWLSPSDNPKADNRKVLTEYSKSMKNLLQKGTYNAGRRPSEHHISEDGFLVNHGGAIPPNVVIPHIDNNETDLINILPIANTKSTDPYQRYCRQHNIIPHPARMQEKLAAFFVQLLTDENDLVLDPFAGSNTTGFVAENLNRQWLSIEMKSEYIESSQARFQVPQ